MYTMKLEFLACYLVLVVDQSHAGSKITDPMSLLKPLRSNLQSPAPSQIRPVVDDPVHSGLQQDSTNSKRDLDGSQIVIASSLHKQNQIDVTEDNAEMHEEQCAYTFLVPRDFGKSCVRTTSQVESEKMIVGLHREVLNTKTEVESMRNEMVEEKQDMPTSREIGEIQESVTILQKESRNVDSRVSQLYLQLLHEIINKRDNSLEIQQLENKLLNQTVEYHILKEKYEELKQEHTQLRDQIITLSTEFEKLRQHKTTQVENNISPTITVLAQQPGSTIQVRANNKRTQETTNLPPGPFKDCVAVQRAGYSKSGVFNLKLPSYNKKIRVWCDFDQDPGGWIVIQRRSGRRVSFYRDMQAYKKGFGRPHSDYWLGLENLHQLTNQTGINFKLHVALEDWDGKKTFVEYNSFRVEGESSGYKLKINHYSGTAGDSLTWHNNNRFTTMDADHDLFDRNCAQIHRGGWWYNSCAHSNLNGIYYRRGYYRSRYQDGIYWSEWRGGSYSLKTVSMKIRSTE